MAKYRSKNKKPQSFGPGAFAILIIVILLLCFMSLQIYQLKQKEASYIAREQELQEEYAAETERSQELDELEAYMQTDEYIESVAKSKLGLAYENEIIFKESGD